MEMIPNVHPMLVHFSIALLTMSAVFYSAGLLFKRKASLLSAGRWNLWSGTLFSLATLVTGWMAYNTVAHDALAHEAMTLHRNWAIPTFALWAVAFLWSLMVKAPKQSVFFIIWLWVATAALGVTGYLGAENVYRHGVGVMRLPDTSTEHHHENGASVEVQIMEDKGRKDGDSPEKTDEHHHGHPSGHKH